MKKSLILAGMLAVVYANAQEGNVGINTETPKATLEIVPNATNLAGTTNEGIIIPKLTKARVVAIAADKLVEGTKVYVIDEVTAADTQFIGAGKGFYFYNGTKWVKQLDSDNDTNSELWAQRDNAGVTETYLKPADEKTDFVGYTSGRKWGIRLGQAEESQFNWGNGAKGLVYSEIPLLNVVSSEVLPTTSSIGTNNDYYYFSSDNILLKEAHVALNPKGVYMGKEHRGLIKDVGSPMNFFSGLNSSVDFYSNSTANSIIGNRGIISIGDDKKSYSNATVRDAIAGEFIARNYGTSTNMFGARAYVNNYGTASNLRGVQISTSSQVALNGTTAQHTIASLRGLQNFANVNENATVTGDIYTSYNELNIRQNATLGNAIIRGNYSRIITNTSTAPIGTIVNFQSVFRPTGTEVGTYMDYGTYPSLQAGSSVKEYIGYNMSQGSNVADSTIENFYGVKIGNLTKGTTSNFAIHTGTRGIVHIGDKLGVGTETPTQRIEANGNILANEGGLMSSLNSPIGGYLELINPIKDTDKEVRRWRIYNMTNKDVSYDYIPGLHFWSYAADGTNLSSQMVLTDAGNLGIGFGSRDSVSGLTNEKLEVKGNIRSTSLAGTGTRNVVADENGVLRVGEATSTGATTLTGDTGLECNATNRGKMNFIQGADGKSDVFGICMKNADGNYYWGYMVGGNNPTNGTGAFGSGL